MAKLIIFLAAFAVFTVVPSLSADDVLQIYPDNREYLLKLGATQELNCSVNTTGQNAKLMWTTPTLEGITQREETTIYSTKYLLRFSLTVENFAEANAGEYKCILIKNGETVSETSIYLKPVEEIKTEPIFVRDNKDATLSCNIKYDDHIPEAGLTWLKNGERIVDLKDHDRYTIVDENHTLTISNPTREDAGLYIARFDIEGKQHPYNCEVQYKASPLVLDFEKSRNIIEGDDLELKCVVKGFPYTVITWSKNGKVINDSRVQLKSLDGHEKAYLHIRRVEFSDAGDYSCLAVSAAFINETSEKNITVRVKDKLAALWPFLGIVGEVVLLCIVILIYEKRRSKQVELEDNAARDIDGASANKNEGLRHRNTNNPTA